MATMYEYLYTVINLNIRSAKFVNMLFIVISSHLDYFYNFRQVSLERELGKFSYFYE